MTDPKRSKELENLLSCQERITLLGHFMAGIAHEIIDPRIGDQHIFRHLGENLQKKGEKRRFGDGKKDCAETPVSITTN